MNDWYHDWAMGHCRTFGIGEERIIEAILSWRIPLLDYLHATEAELHEATRHCVVFESPPPKWPEDHLAAIKRHLAVVKAENAARAEREYGMRFERDRGTCVNCGDSGGVVVPHPKFIVNLEWVPSGHNLHGDPIRATCAVCCDCWKGRKVYDAACLRLHGTGQPTPLTIAQYRSINPDWQHQMAAVEAARVAMDKASEAAAAVRADQLAKDLADRMRVPK